MELDAANWSANAHKPPKGRYSKGAKGTEMG